MTQEKPLALNDEVDLGINFESFNVKDIAFIENGKDFSLTLFVPGYQEITLIFEDMMFFSCDKNATESEGFAIFEASLKKVESGTELLEHIANVKYSEEIGSVFHFCVHGTLGINIVSSNYRIVDL